jgi:hypothetical protein
VIGDPPVLVGGVQFTDAVLEELVDPTTFVGTLGTVAVGTVTLTVAAGPRPEPLIAATLKV